MIAEKTGKRHDHVVADIRKMFAKLNLHAPDFSGTYQTARGNTYTEYLLPERYLMNILMGYSG